MAARTSVAIFSTPRRSVSSSTGTFLSHWRTALKSISGAMRSVETSSRMSQSMITAPMSARERNISTASS